MGHYFSLNSLEKCIYDARPLIFARINFGLLMIVYACNKCTDSPAPHPNAENIFPFKYRIPEDLSTLIFTIPWFTQSTVYFWNLVPSLLLLSAFGIATGFGIYSRFSCLLFSLLKLSMTLLDISNYNNHEYLYALLAFGFAICQGTYYIYIRGIEYIPIMYL